MTELPREKGTAVPGAPLVHVHIPKTAGSTFNGILRRKFDSSLIYEYPSYFNDTGLDQSALLQASSDKAIVLGHLDIACQSYLPESALFVCFLRNPLERVISGYFNILRDTSNPDHAKVTRLSLAEYVESEVVRDVDNGMVRRLVPGGARIDGGSVTESHLEIARNVIVRENFFVGITEKFDESLHLLAQRVGAGPWHYTSLNVRRGRIDIDPRDAQLILERNQLDVTLYREQYHRLMTDVAEAYGMDKRVGRFKLAQHLFAIASFPGTMARKARNRWAQPN